MNKFYILFASCLITNSFNCSIASNAIDHSDIFTVLFEKLGTYHDGNKIQKFVIEYLNNASLYELGYCTDDENKMIQVEKYRSLEGQGPFYTTLTYFINFFMYLEIHYRLAQQGFNLNDPEFYTRQLTHDERTIMNNSAREIIQDRIDRLKLLIHQ